MDDKLFRFYLNFKNDNTVLVEITEPVGFDSANFVIEQDKKRYGRDVMYGSESVDLEFYKGLFESQGFSMQFEKLLQYYKDYGFEAEVEFIVEVDGSQLVVGLLDYQKAETDQIEYFKTKVIQNTNMAIVKRNEDVNVDVFSDTDLFDNPITPITTQRILLKAKPVVQISEWDSKSLTTASQIGSGFNCQISIPIANQLLRYKIEDSYAPFDPFFKGLDVSFAENNDYRYANRLLTAKNDLSNVKVKLKNVTLTGNTNLGTYSLNYSMAIFDSDGDWIQNVGTTTFLYQNPNTANVTNQDFEFTIPFIGAGTSLMIDGNCFFSSGNLRSFNMFLGLKCDGVEIQVTSTAVDSVITGVRHIDYLKQVVKSASGLNVIAPKYDVGGQFYDNFVFNGKLIRQFINEAFYGTIKENVEQLVELNADYQINQNNVYVGQYSDFYTNNEVGSYLTAPDSNFKNQFNDRYTLNTFEYKYKSFEQDRDESNTIDAIHTSTQWKMPNLQVESNLKIDVPFVRDPFEIESARRQGIQTKDTTSLSNDDKVYILDVVALAPNTRKTITRVLQWQKDRDNDTYKILSDGAFNWTLLGFSVGDTIIVDGVNYVVAALENTILTLNYTGTTNANGESLIEIDYPITNVTYTNRTNEGFISIENIQTGDNFSNLRYSIKRNLKHWESYLKTASKFKPNGKIKNTYYKSNGLAKTKYQGETDYTIEGADILVNDLNDAILSPYVYETKLIAGFDDVKETLDKMQTINPDNSIGGFIRIMDNNFKVVKVYPTKLDYMFATAELTLIGEELQESEFLTIQTIGTDLIKINEVGYDSTIIKPIQLRTNGDYIQILDSRGVGLNNEIKFDKVVVNSNIFSNIVELSEALLTL